MPVFEKSPGNTLAYEHRPPKDPGGVTFVYFNALTGDKSMWESAVDPDLAAGHGMLAFNYRGQAGSDFTSSSFDESSIVDDAAALLEHLAPRTPVFVGLSIGGLFAAKVHLEKSPDAAGLVLINTLRRDGPRLQWINDALVRAAEVGGLALLRDLYTPLLFDEAWLAGNRANFLKDEGYIPLEPGDGDYLLLKAGGTANWDLPLEALDLPVLNVTGLQDHVFHDADDVDRLFARLPNAERLDMPDAGHLVPAEKPGELATALASFARRCTGGVHG